MKRQLALTGASLLLVAGGITAANALPACIHEDGSGQGPCFWNAQTQGNGQGTSVVNDPSWNEQATQAWLMFDAAGAGALVPAGHAVEYTAHSYEPFILGPNHIQVHDTLGNYWLFTFYIQGV